MPKNNGSNGSKKRYAGMMNAEVAALGPGEYEKEFGNERDFRTAPSPSGFQITELGPMSARLKAYAAFNRRCQREAAEASSVLEALKRASRVAGKHAHLFAPQFKEAKRAHMVAVVRANYAESNFFGEVLTAFPDAVWDALVMGPEGHLGVINPDPQEEGLLMELLGRLCGGDPFMFKEVAGRDLPDRFVFPPDGD